MCETCGCGDPEVVPIEVQESLLAENDRTAEHNRQHFAGHLHHNGVCVAIRQQTSQAAPAGHPVTAQAAATILEAGGNAFDAAVAALLASCVAEPVLASLGGGGFLLVLPAGGEPVVYDFFAQTPRRRRPEAELDFYPILADFGSAQQEFHIGLGSVATPGTVRGLFRIHRELCRLPLAEIATPALAD